MERRERRELARGKEKRGEKLFVIPTGGSYLLLSSRILSMHFYSVTRAIK